MKKKTTSLQNAIRAPINKCLRSPGIEESIPPAYEAWQAGTPNRIFFLARLAVNRFMGSLKGLQIWAPLLFRCRKYGMGLDV